MMSYTFSVISSILGEFQSKSPSEDLDIVKVDSLSHSIVVKRIGTDDNNFYELKLRDQKQMNQVLEILFLSHKPDSFLLNESRQKEIVNHYTSHGQYLEFTYNGVLVNLDINVLGKNDNVSLNDDRVYN